MSISSWWLHAVATLCAVLLFAFPAVAAHHHRHRHASSAHHHRRTSKSSKHRSHRARHQHHRVRAERSRLRAYQSQMNHAHETAAGPSVTRTPEGRLVLHLWSMNTHATCDLTPQRADGGFDDSGKTEFARVLGDPHSHATHPIDDRLMDLVYQVAEHFNAGQITVVSGFREADHDSNHGHGRAVDFLIPGVSDHAVAQYALDHFQGVGVGIYPVSGFVHLDVRDRNYTWVDTSGPGQRPRYRHARRRHHHHH